jgi:sugar/nucleoside kinase (ribokinase family)
VDPAAPRRAAAVDRAAVDPAAARRAARRRAVVVGPVHLDLTVRGEAPLEREALDAWVGPSDIGLLAAGSAGYTAMALARLGWSVRLVSRAGDDPFGATLLAGLRASGVDTALVETAAGTTTLALYLLLWGGVKRPMTYRLGDDDPWPDPPPVDLAGPDAPALLLSSGLLHFPSMWGRGLAAVLREARAAGILTAVDPQFPLGPLARPWLPGIADALAAADVLLCDETEACGLFDVRSGAEAIGPAHAAGPRIVVVKRGASGSLVSDGTRVLEQPAPSVAAALVAEAIGAGDAYDAGFLDALAAGETLEAAARRGTAVALLSLSGRGGAEAIESGEALETALGSVPPARVAG